MSSAFFKCQEHVIPAQHIREYSSVTNQGLEVQLKLVVKQYIPLSNSIPKPDDVTIVAVSGNGFPKELYEPLWDDLLAGLQTIKTVRIRNIWIVDMATQGASGILNEMTIGSEPSWDDHSRDLLHMINHFRVLMPLPIIGIGHSLGANQLVNLSLMHPSLFHSLILLEPYIQPNTHRLTGHALVLASLHRRDSWNSRSAAAAAFRKGLRGWDARCVDLYIQHGLSDFQGSDNTEGGTVALTTRKAQETLMMLRPHGAMTNLPEPRKSSSSKDKTHIPIYDRLVFRPEPIRVLSQLQFIRPSVFYLFGRSSPVSTPSARLEKLENTGKNAKLGGSGGLSNGRVSSVILENQGHLVPFQAVESCAGEITKWLDKELARWINERKLLRTMETPGSSGLSEEYRQRIVAEDWDMEDTASKLPERAVKMSKL